jgi:TonB family protein
VASLRARTIALFGCLTAVACSHGPKGPEAAANQAITERGRVFKAYFDPMRERVTAAAQTVPQETFPAGDYYTVLAVELSPDGKVAKLGLAQSCGVSGIDRVALLAFAKAQPFSPPPAQLIDAAGRAKFQFGMHFRETGTDPADPDAAATSPPPARISAEVGASQRLADLNDEQYRPRLPADLIPAGAIRAAELDVCVSAAGQVTSVAVTQSSGHKAIDDAWVAATKTWPYRPYSVDGRAVPFCHPVRAEIPRAP